MNNKTLEICIPIFNEEEVIENFFYDLLKWIDKVELKNKFKKIMIRFLNNGSTDKSLTILKKLKQKFKILEITSLKKNYGFYTSTSYLIYSSKADFVILMPSDYQIPFLSVQEALEKTILTGNSSFLVRNKSKGSSKFVLSFKKIFYKILKTISYDSIDGYFGMGVYTSKSLSVIKNYPYSPFQLRLVIPFINDNYNIIKFNELKRKAGKTSFGLTKYIIESFKLIISSQKLPTYLSIALLSFFSLITMSFLPLIVFIKFLAPTLFYPGFATLIILFFLMMSLQSIFALVILLEIKSRDGIAGLSIIRRKRPIVIENNFK